MKKALKMDYYDIDKIIRDALSGGTNISPSDRKDWVMFGVALRTLGYSDNHFAALSWQDAKTQGICRKVWHDNRGVRMDEGAARAKIAALAQDAGMDLRGFVLSPEERDKREFDKVKLPPTGEEPPRPPVFIDLDAVSRMERRAGDSTLYNFLCRLFPPEEVGRVFRLYRVGGEVWHEKQAPELASTFPYINAANNCVDVAIQPFDVTATEVHKQNNRGFMLARMKQNHRRAPWCLFGEHLLNFDPSAPVGVVESEKTALIAALAAPGYVWVATSSESNLNERRCKELKGRQVYIFPDNDRIEEWRQKAERLQTEGFNVYFCDGYITRHATEPKDDVADIICRWMQRGGGVEA